jgi:hypothetical protein
MAEQKIVVAVYMDDGRVFEYDVVSHDKAREHAAAIVHGGYRHTIDGELEHYPPHRILKVKATGVGVGTSYPDRVRGT